MSWELIIFLIAAGILGIISLVETAGYRTFLKGAKQLESYIVQYNANADKITAALRDIGVLSESQLRAQEAAFRDMGKLERNMEIIVDVLSLHSEALNIKSSLQFKELLDKVEIQKN